MIRQTGRQPRSGLIRLFVGLLAGCGLVFVAERPATAQTGRDARARQNRLEVSRRQHREYHEKLAETLSGYLTFCRGRGNDEQAAKIQDLIDSAALETIRLEPLPRKVQPEIASDLPEEERNWRVRVRHARRDYARELYLLSRRVLHAGFPSYAYQLVRESASHDPDHKSARRLLGYVRHGDEWLTPFAAEMARNRQVWHDRFGWLPVDHVERYENGQRYFNGRWISAAQEAELRRDFRNAWEIRTDHYLVKTNHSLERGVEIATTLEEFHRIFSQTFAAFFHTPEQLQKLFTANSGRSRPAAQSPPHEVHYYRTREEYDRRLIEKIPQIAITNGLYYPDDRIAYFFHNPEAEGNTTLYHEATHQLFYESDRRDRSPGGRRDFWIIEGIACYMESLKQEEGRVSLGDPLFPRFFAARHRYLVDDYYIPLSRFTSMGMYEFQNHPNIARNYSQASGLTQFFMEYDEGKYRDALIEHLVQLYRPSGRSQTPPQSLQELTGVTWNELDRQYGEFLREVELRVPRLKLPQEQEASP